MKHGKMGRGPNKRKQRKYGGMKKEKFLLAPANKRDLGKMAMPLVLDLSRDESLQISLSLSFLSSDPKARIEMLQKKKEASGR